MLVYLAGPEVFLPDALTVGRRKLELCARYNLTGLFPLDNDQAIDPSAPGASLQIFRGNEVMMDRADAIVANLTPFRGPSADAGTIYELGYMAGRGKRCLGYSNDPALYVERVATPGSPSDGGRQVDSNGHTIEPFNLRDNLMIVHALDTHGHPLVTPSVSPGDPWRDLAAFEDCLRLIAGVAEPGS